MNRKILEEPSILYHIEKMLGITSGEDTAFENDIITHINAILSVLTQMGVIEEPGFYITSEDEQWDDLTEHCVNKNSISDIKTLLYLRVKMIFDPPTSPAVMNSFTDTIKELETRLYTYSGGY